MEKILNLKNIIICLIILCLVIVSVVYKPNNDSITKSNEESLLIKDDVSSEEIIFIDIKGAVNKPGVYQLTNQNMVIDQTTPNMIRDNIAKNLIIAEI